MCLTKEGLLETELEVDVSGSDSDAHLEQEKHGFLSKKRQMLLIGIKIKWMRMKSLSPIWTKEHTRS
jgi:hypothetical protein